MIDHVFATADFPVTSPSGQRLVVRKGTHWPVEDPIVKANPGNFSADPRWGLAYSEEPAGWDDPPVETATAAPGERRNIRRVTRDT